MRNMLNRFANLFVPTLLRSPLHGLLSSSVILITFIGRKSGRTYQTPVQYQRVGDRLRCFTKQERLWWRNLQGGAPLTIRLQGKDLRATARVTVNEPTTIGAGLAQMHPTMPATVRERMANEVIMIEIALEA
jgi:F420H(2)-dependent quinone reductase